MTDLPEIKALNSARADEDLEELLAREKERLSRFGGRAGAMTVCMSRQRLSIDTLDKLLAFAEKRQVAAFLAAVSSGAKVNPSESRPAWHMALRTPEFADKAAKEVADTASRILTLAEAVRSGEKTGATGKSINAVVHIGIGGSDLGPRMLAQAFKPHRMRGLKLRFAANVDAAEIHDALHGLDPERTLVLAVSKSFTTRETLMNAMQARDWLVAGAGQAAMAAQFLAVSAKPDTAHSFGVAKENVFPFADWVGGRYSLWSAVGLSLIIAFGADFWRGLLAGAAEMDRHVVDTPLAQNLPVLSALIQFWNLNFLHLPARAIVPYAARLALLPAWMQQLVMESNGKSIGTNGKPAQFWASPVIMGDAGTNAQHAFFQALHQGPLPVPVDFIGVVEDAEKEPEHHRTLLANMLGQARALMTGKPVTKVRGELKDMPLALRDVLAPQKMFPGNRPSTTFLLDSLSPRAIGNLLAFYEHETVVLARLAGINPFDQWGVQLGKTLALNMEKRLLGKTTDELPLDAASEALLARLRKPEN